MILIWLTGFFALFLCIITDYQSDVESAQRKQLAAQVIDRISQGDYSALHQPYRQEESPRIKLNEGGTSFLPIVDQYIFMNEEVDLDARFAPYGFSSEYCSIHLVGSNGRQLHAVFKIDRVKDELILKEISIY